MTQATISIQQHEPDIQIFTKDIHTKCKVRAGNLWFASAGHEDGGEGANTSVFFFFIFFFIFF